MAEQNGSTDLARDYRPIRFNDVVGQPEAVNILRGFEKAGEWPHTILFLGASGCGKTTLARIVARKMGCIVDTSLGKRDFYEVNAALERGIDLVRDIEQKLGMSAFRGRDAKRVWLIDEVHKLSSDAMSGFLKILEEPPKRVHFLLATTDPDKLLPTIRTRCTHIPVKPLKESDIVDVLTGVLVRKQGKDGSKLLTDAEYRAIAGAAYGSARRAVKIMEQILVLEPGPSRLEAIVKEDVKKDGFELTKLLLWKGAKWENLSKILDKGLSDDAEAVRKVMLGCARKELLTGRNPGWAALIIEFMKDPFYTDGDARLAFACWQVLQYRK